MIELSTWFQIEKNPIDVTSTTRVWRWMNGECNCCFSLSPDLSVTVTNVARVFNILSVDSSVRGGIVCVWSFRSNRTALHYEASQLQNLWRAWRAPDSKFLRSKSVPGLSWSTRDLGYLLSESIVRFYIVGNGVHLNELSAHNLSSSFEHVHYSADCCSDNVKWKTTTCVKKVEDIATALRFCECLRASRYVLSCWMTCTRRNSNDARNRVQLKWSLSSHGHRVCIVNVQHW